MRALAALIAAVLLAPVTALVGPAAPAHAAPAGDQEVVAFLVRGVGNGHGRGMSQWGAYGRALAGQTWQQILNAYYGGTTGGTRAEDHLRVRLMGWDGTGRLGVVSASGRARWSGSTTNYTSLYATETSPNVFTVYGEPDDRACPGAAALTVPKVNLQNGSTGASVTQLQQVLAAFGFSPGPVDGIFGTMTEAAVKAFEADEGLTVDGLWRQADWQAAQARLDGQGGSAAWQVVQAGVVGPIRFTTTVDQTIGAPGDVLGVCQPSGQLTHYRGVVELRDTTDGNRVVNDVDVENYLRGVVPKEVSASWGSAGGGLGMNALRAQAVAARSYSLSQNRYTYAKTCDTTSCQVYGGSATRLSATSNIVLNVEYATTDQAIAETAGVVRVKNGSVVSTEFSASNGPRTAGGSYPPVDDPWDDVPNNPNHRWTRVIDADTIRSRYGLASANGVATVRDADSIFDGIWANEVRLGNGATVSAWDFRNAFVLPSPGFDLVPIRRGVSNAGSFSFIGDSVGVSIAGTSTSELRVLTEGVFASATYDAVVGRRTQGGVVDDGVSAASRVPIGTGVVLVELGYNDDPAAMAGRIDAVMSKLQSRRVGVVAWVTVSERRSQFAATNDAIVAAQNRWRNLVVLDWEAASRARAADRWFADDVHLTTTGRAELGAFLRGRLVQLAAGYTPSRPLLPGKPLRIPVLGQGGVPETGVAGVALNVTAVRTTAAGYLRVWPCDADEPETSSVNFQAAGAVEPNAVVVPIGASGEVCVSTLVATDVIVDVTAWFDGGLGSAAGRLVDTRSGARLKAGKVLRVPVLGEHGVPDSGVAGVALNVTAVRTSAAGYLRVWSCDEVEPGTSSVNFQAAGAVEPNAVVVPVGASGDVCVSSLVDTDVIVDVSGWFESGVRSASGRLIDTRRATRVAAGAVLRVPVTGRFGVPASGAAGVALNVTAVRTAGAGYLQVWPCGSPRPDTSSVNFQRAGAVEPNAVLVPVDDTGEVCVSSLVDSDVIVDVTAWFDAGLRGSPGERLVDTRFGVGPLPPR